MQSMNRESLEGLLLRGAQARLEELQGEMATLMGAFPGLPQSVTVKAKTAAATAPEADAKTERHRQRGLKAAETRAANKKKARSSRPLTSVEKRLYGKKKKLSWKEKAAHIEAGMIKRQHTMMTKYGTTSPLKVAEIKAQMAKTAQTDNGASSETH